MIKAISNLALSLAGTFVVIGAVASLGSSGNVFNPVKFANKWQESYKNINENYYIGLKLYPEYYGNHFTNFDDWYNYYNNFNGGYYKDRYIRYSNDFEKASVYLFVWTPYNWSQAIQAINFVENANDIKFTPCGYFDNTRYCITSLQNSGDLIKNFGLTLAIPVCFFTDTVSNALAGVVATFTAMYST